MATTTTPAAGVTPGAAPAAAPDATPGTVSTPLRLVQHLGVPVRDLDRSLAFYRRLTGAEPLFVDRMRGDGFARGVGVPGAACRFAMLPLGNTRLELIEYTAPRGADYALRNCDVGAIHLAFEVDDVRAVYARLSAEGVRFHAPPHTFTPEDGAPDVVGATFCYLSDPDGIQLELNQPAWPAAGSGATA